MEAESDFSSLDSHIEQRSWNNYGEEIDPSQTCPKCAVGRGVTYCTIHGDKYINYKCIFCCSIAQFNCGGNYFYCLHHHGDDPSNSKNGGNCEGDKEKCPLGIDHIPNLPHKDKEDDIFKDPNPVGYGLGCSLCREIKEGSN